MLPTASLVRTGLPGLSTLKIFSGESQLTLTRVLSLSARALTRGSWVSDGDGTLETLLDCFLVFLEVAGEWTS